VSRPTWDETWLKLAELMAARSRCPTGAGCAIVDSQQRVVATGYAGPPADYLTADEERAETCIAYCRRAWTDPEFKDPQYLDCPSAHAESNALSFAERSRVEGATLYVSSSVCGLCVKVVANSGVVRVVWPRVPGLEYRNEDASVRYLERCGIRVDIVDL